MQVMHKWLTFLLKRLGLVGQQPAKEKCFVHFVNRMKLDFSALEHNRRRRARRAKAVAIWVFILNHTPLFLCLL